MPIKIIHHRENVPEDSKQKHCFDINIKESLQKLCFLCNQMINFSCFMFEYFDLDKIKQNNDFDLLNEKIDYIQEHIKNFELIFGKKMSIFECISKATMLMQKIQVLSNKFGISLVVEEHNENEEYLTDDDIDMMAQIFEDFGVEQIRKDAQECRKEFMEERKMLHKMQTKPLEVYDVYHDNDLGLCNNKIANNTSNDYQDNYYYDNYDDN